MIITPDNFRTKALDHNFSEPIDTNGLIAYVGKSEPYWSFWLMNARRENVVSWFYDSKEDRDEDYDRLMRLYSSND